MNPCLSDPYRNPPTNEEFPCNFCITQFSSAPTAIAGNSVIPSVMLGNWESQCPRANPYNVYQGCFLQVVIL